MYYYVPHTGKFQQSARSVTRTSYVPRRSYDDEVLYTPYRPYSYSHRYDTSGYDNIARSTVNKELIMSSAAMEDNFDISNRSRQRDRDVLAAANRAISPSMSTTSRLGSMSRGVSEVRRAGSLRRSYPRSSSVPPKRPTSVTTTTLIPLDLSSPDPPRQSQYLKYSNSFQNSRSLGNNYTTMYSQALRTPRSPSPEFSPYRDNSPFRDISPYRSDSSLSPTSSGMQTPVDHWYPPGSSRVSRKRRKPRVLSTKRKMGNYYNRLLNRRSTDSGGQMGKYWPYIDVDDIENTSVGDLFSDTESIGESGSTYLVQGGNTGGYYGNYDDGDKSLVSYSPDSDSDIPSDYVPFRPRVRYRSPERDYSELSVIPYIPKRDPTMNTTADDIAFNAVVAASAIRARKALEQINFDEYDSAGMVLSVEGEYRSPGADDPVGFRYVSRPIALKVPASSIVSAYDSDNAFTKYITDLQKFREGIRKRLEEGYRALSAESKSYRPSSLPTSSYQSYTSRPSLELKPYRKRLRDDADYKYGQSLELYPIASSQGESMRSRSRSRQRYTEDELPESRAIKLYDSNIEPDSRLSTLTKVQIKATTEQFSSPRAAVAARRAMRGHSTPPGPVQTSAYISQSEAALIGSKVDVALPKRRPRSAYGQEKLRQIHLHSSSRDASPVGATASAAAAASTAGLQAHKPVCVPAYSKRIQDVDGPKRPSIMSWQYRIDAYTPPEDLVYVPSSLSTMKAQVRDCKDKLDRHRQLMDRYLVSDTGLSADDMQVLMNIKSRKYPEEPALPNEIKPSERAKRRRQKLLKKHRLEY